MARILLHWLNEEVQLSQDVTSIAEDFRNGYLLGELLYKYNQQHHFDKFTDKDTPDAKITNFCLLEPTMRQIGVFFNSQVAFDIMHAKPGTMKTLLYEIRTVLEGAQKMSKSVDSGQMKNIMQIIKPSVPHYDKTKSITFENAIRSMIENPNDVLMERATHRFTDMNQTFRQSVSDSHSRQLSEMKFELERKKAMTRERNRHEKEFQQTWDHINKEQWKRNQIRARARRNLTQSVTAELTRRKESRKAMENTSARDKSIASIDDFEQRLADMKKGDEGSSAAVDTLTLKSAGGEEGTGIPELSYLNEETLREGMIRNQKEMSDRNERLLLRQQEHDRRRKRFVRLRESYHSSILQTEAEGEIFTQVLQTSEMEEVEKIARMRAMVHKNMFKQNACNRQSLIKNREAENSLFTDQCRARDAKLERDWVVCNRVEAQENRLRVLKEAMEAARSQEIIELAWAEIDRVLDLTDWIVNMRALGAYRGGTDLEGPTSLLPQTIMSDVSGMYVAEDLLIPLALPVPESMNVFDQYPLSLSWKPKCPQLSWLLAGPFRGNDFMTDASGENMIGEEADTVEEIVAEKDAFEKADVISPSLFSEHLMKQDASAFSTAISSFEPLPVEEISDKGGKSKDKSNGKEKGKKGATEEEEARVKVVPPPWILNVPSHCLLGEVILCVRCTADPVDPHPTAPDNIQPLSMRIALCGSSEFVKKSVAAAMEKEYNLSVLRVEELVSQALTIGKEIFSSQRSSPMSDSEQLAFNIYNDAAKGNVTDDDQYVSLLVDAISSLDPSCPGFVIEDFPNTKEQASKLVIALSNVDYDSKRPQMKDKASPFLSTIEREDIPFDCTQCGLDKVFFFDVDPEFITTSRIRQRKDLRTGEVVTLTDDTVHVDTLAELVTPKYAMDTLSLDVATSSYSVEPIRESMSSLGVAEGIAVDANDIDATVEAVLVSIREWKDSKSAPEPSSTDCNADKEMSEDNGVESTDAEAVVEMSEAAPIIIREGELSPSLAQVLSNVWFQGEFQMQEACRQFFSAMRETHYHMVQRRGAIRHATITQLLLRDNKQQIFDEFRDNFNSFENDFRFDSDLMNELYLRSLELREVFLDISDEKAKKANSVLQNLSMDAATNVLIHNVQSEGAALLQSYISLFVAGLNVLFDYMRSVSSYDCVHQYNQVLEEVSPAVDPTKPADETVSGKVGKEKDKKGKGGNNVRLPLAPPVLWEDMSILPEPANVAGSDEDAGKGKKKEKNGGSKSKGKKGADDASADNPFSMCSQNALGFCETWSRSSFKVDREIYGGDEDLASAIEKAVWHETDRFEHVIKMAADVINAQTEWLENQESLIMEQMQQTIAERTEAEHATTERLVAMIRECIENNVPICHQWQLASDTIVVREDRLVVPPPDDQIVPTVNIFQPSHMNDEQICVTKRMLDEMQLGEVILHEDLLAWYNLCESGVGPLGCTFGQEGEFNGLVFPKLWRRDHDHLLKSVYRPVNVAGTKEEVGTIDVTSVLERMRSYGDERYSVIRKWTGSL